MRFDLASGVYKQVSQQHKCLVGHLNVALDAGQICVVQHRPRMHCRPSSISASAREMLKGPYDPEHFLVGSGQHYENHISLGGA